MSNWTRGDDRKLRKVSSADVLEMRALWRGGKSSSEVASRFGLSESGAHAAIRGITWGHLPGAVTREETVILRHPRGERHGLAKLTESAVAEMRSVYRQGESTWGLAKRFGVCFSTAKSAIRGFNWTHLENAVPPGEHRRFGTHRRGERHCNAKLRDQKVVEMRGLYRAGSTVQAIADRFGLGYSTAHAALTGTGWAHVPGALTASEMRPPGPKR
jgi:transposase